MTNLVAVDKCPNSLTHSVFISADSDGVHMSRAAATARAAAKYASQLSDEYHRILHCHLAKADPKLAARFSTLIIELTTMTDATLENVRFRK